MSDSMDNSGGDGGALRAARALFLPLVGLLLGLLWAAGQRKELSRHSGSARAMPGGPLFQTLFGITVAAALPCNL